MDTLEYFMKGKDPASYRGFVKLQKQWYEFDVGHVLEKFPEVDLESFEPVILKNDEVEKFDDRASILDNFERQILLEKGRQDIPAISKTLQECIREGLVQPLPDAYIADNMAVWSADSFCQQKAKVLQRCIHSRADLMKTINQGQKELDYLKKLVKKYPIS